MLFSFKRFSWRKKKHWKRENTDTGWLTEPEISAWRVYITNSNWSKNKSLWGKVGYVMHVSFHFHVVLVITKILLTEDEKYTLYAYDSNNLYYKTTAQAYKWNDMWISPSASRCRHCLPLMRRKWKWGTRWWKIWRRRFELSRWGQTIFCCKQRRPLHSMTLSPVIHSYQLT